MAITVSRAPSRREDPSRWVLGAVGAALCCVGGGVSAQDATGCDLPPGSTAPSTALLHSADCHRARGDAARALAILDDAATAPGAEREALILGRRGQLHLALGDYAIALDLLSEALESDRTRLTPDEAAMLLNDLGGAYMAVDEPLPGVAAFADASRFASPGTPLSVIAAVNFARALAASGGGAIRARLDSASAAAHRLPRSATQAEILLALADLYLDAGGGEVADAAAALARDALVFAAAAPDERLRGEALGRLGRARAAAGALDESLAHTRAAVTASQGEGADGNLYRWEWQAGRVLRAKGDDAGALTAYESAIDTLGATRIAAAQSRSGFVRNVLPLYQEYADLKLASVRGLAPAEASPALLEVRRTLEQFRIAEVRNYFENQCSVPDVFDPTGSAAERVVVIYPLVFADRTEILASAGDRVNLYTVPVDLARMSSAVSSLRQAIEDPGSGDAYLRPAQLLYSWILAPLEEMLEETEATTLIVVPDSPLRTIPFAVLHDGSRFVAERFALGITPALSLVGAAAPAPESRALLNGIIAPTRGFAGLPFVAAELASIDDVFPSRTFTDESFVTATLEREVVQGGYSVVHMATHAQFEADYRRSFLLAHDNVITMDDLEEVIGSQRYSDRPVDLLVLSACRTAAGDERAALGLAGVAVKAGARSALASLWSVNDESTALLMAEFYRELATQRGKAAALRGAQLALMNDARYSHPAYWAPFLMIGDWR
jgi:CHAT domain-containing protein